MIGLVLMVALVALIGFMMAANATVLLVDEQGNIIGEARRGGRTTCTDSDGGRDYYERGTTRAGSTTKTDGCTGSKDLTEYYCRRNRIRSTSYSCENGCQNGQCVSACTPNCADKECGNDGCGGSCGTCQSSQTCQNNQCISACVPEVCDGKDNDCDGQIDEDCDTLSYVFIVKNTDTLLKIAPLAVNNDKVPVIIYTEGREYEIILFLKALTKDVLVKIVYEDNENFNNIERYLTNEGIEYQKSTVNEMLVSPFRLISFSDNEELKPYASAWAGKNNGLFLDSVLDVSRYIEKIPSRKIIYFGNNDYTRRYLYSYSSNIEQVPDIRNAEIKLNQGISSEKIVTVIPKVTSDYSKLGVLYVLYRNTALISVEGDAAGSTFSFDNDIDRQLNLLRPYNNNQEFKYMTIVADRLKIPYTYRMPIEIINMSDNPFLQQFSADILYADRNSAWSSSDIGDQDKYFIPDMGVGRITGYDLTSASILLNLGWLKENNLIQISKKAVFSSDWDITWTANCSIGYRCWDSKSIIENLNKMYGASKVDSYGDPTDTNSLINNPPLDLILDLAKNSEFVILKGHGGPNYLSATEPHVNADSILSRRPHKPSLWYLHACSTIKHVNYDNNLDSTLRSLSTNVYGSVDLLGTGSGWASWIMPYFNQGHKIGDVIRFALQDSRDYFITIAWPYGEINPNIPSQMELIGDPLVSYGNNHPSYMAASAFDVSASLMGTENQRAVPLFSGMINLVSSPFSTYNIRFEGDCGRMIIINNLAQLQRLANINMINYNEIRNLLSSSEGVILDANQNRISSLQKAAALIVESNCNLIFEK